MKLGLKIGGNLILYLTCAFSGAIILVTLISALLVQWTPSLGISHNELIRDYSNLIGYLLLLSDKNLVFNFLPMSSSALQHFTAVRNLMLVNEGVFLVSWGYLLLMRKKLKKRNQLLALISLLDYLCLLLIIIAVFSCINFNTEFLDFHYLLFSGNSWQFNPRTDPIITVMPIRFFLRLFMIAFAIVILILQLMKHQLKRLLMSGQFCSQVTNDCGDHCNDNNCNDN